MPLSPGRISPRSMDDRQWATFVAQSGIQADRTVKSFPPTWSGFSADPVGEISYYDFGRIVVMWNDTGSILVGTSDDTTMSFTGLPDEITPDNNVILPTFVIDSGSVFAGQVSITSAGTVGYTLLTVSGSLILAGVGGLFTGAGNKGLPDGWLIVYAK